MNKYITFYKSYRLEVTCFFIVVISVIATMFSLNMIRVSEENMKAKEVKVEWEPVVKEPKPVVEKPDLSVYNFATTSDVSMKLWSEDISYLTQAEVCTTFTEYSSAKECQMYAAFTVFETAPEDSIYKTTARALKEGQIMPDTIVVNTGYEDVFCYRYYDGLMGRQTVLLIDDMVIVVDYWSDPDDKEDDGCSLLKDVSFTLDNNTYYLSSTF